MIGFARWAERHATTFGIASHEEIATIQAWERVFTACAYEADDLEQATDNLAANADLLARSDEKFLGRMSMHLAAIQRTIRQARAIAYAGKRSRYEAEMGECVHCSGTGRVVVPHIASVRDQKWEPMNVGSAPSWYTMAVLCTCSLGKWFAEHTPKLPPEKTVLTLDAYERANPDWRDQLAARQTAQLAEANVNSAMDGAITQVMKQWRVTSGER